MLTQFTSRCLVWARGLWSELHEHDFLEPAWFVMASEDHLIENEGLSPRTTDFVKATPGFKHSQTKV